MHVDRKIAEVAARCHGVVTRAQLVGLGLDQNAINYRVATGRLHRQFHNAFSVGHAALTEEGAFMAAVASVGPDAGLSSISALALHGIRERRPGEQIHVAVPRRLGRRRDIRVRFVEDPDLMRRSGIPVLFPVQRC